LAAKIEALPEAGRMNAIRGMVEGLASRLAQNGQDLEGWLRLVRSYTVLNEPGKARSALIDAKTQSRGRSKRDRAHRGARAGTRSGRLVLIMTRRKRRLVLISSALAVLSLAVGLVLVALRDNIVFFYGPSELAQKAPRAGQRLRIGGLVKQGSLVHEGDRTVRFAVTDTKQEVEVTYTGLLPDLFRERQGVVAEGTLGQDKLFHADGILAKHDERYMPRDVADALKKQGVWREGAEAASLGK
jgi:cytochrome c-type biogenesis protein CcmE